jgi:hypothetical protein
MNINFDLFPEAKTKALTYGAFNGKLIKTLESLGIVVSHHDFYIPENFLAWNATCHHDDNLMELGQKFSNYGFKGKLKLMYVWGHSFEFERNNNWNLIENFCELISKNKEIWFASNIEVMRYIKALRKLEFSARGDIVYNPTAITVWISVDDEAVEVKCGETIRL